MGIAKHRPAFGAVLLFCLLGTALDAAAQPGVGVERAESAAYSQRLTLTVGRAVVVDLPAEASEILVGDPKVANAVVRSARKIFVMGVAPGETTVIALDKTGAQIGNIEISVGKPVVERDVGSLVKVLRAALPKASIQIKMVGDTLILSGEAESAADSSLALDIAKGFAEAGSRNADGGTDGKISVVNTVTIRGRDQVMVRVTIAEVQRDVLKQLGVSTNPTTPDTLLKGTWATLTQQNSFTLNGGLSNGALTVPLGGAASATLQAFERYGVSRILAEPTVTAVSGENAKFTAGGEIPVPKSSTCSPLTGYCEIGLEFKPYGVTLNMTPVVLSPGRIMLRLATEVTEIDPTKTYTLNKIAVPGFRTRKNETTVELPSGGSLATAGLITNTSRQAVSGLPGLINLPVLGALFRSRDYQRQETELLIVVTPYIAKSSQPGEIKRPDDGLVDSSDPQAWLLGRVNRLYSTRSNPEAAKNLKGRFGFIQD